MEKTCFSVESKKRGPKPSKNKISINNDYKFELEEFDEMSLNESQYLFFFDKIIIPFKTYTQEKCFFIINSNNIIIEVNDKFKVFNNINKF
jgi:hypothetical protein